MAITIKKQTAGTDDLFRKFQDTCPMGMKSGQYTCRCPKGKWSVEGPVYNEVQSEGWNHFNRYNLDGIYN